MHKQQIDYILVRRKWRNSIQDAQAYNSFASIGSDHRIVTVKIRLSLRAPKVKSTRKAKYIWKALEENAALQDKYATEVRSKFQILDGEPATKMYERFASAITATAKEYLQEIPKRKKDRPFSENSRVRQAREEMETAYQKYVGSSEKCSETYIVAKNNLNKVYEELEKEDLERKIEEIERCHNDNQAAQSWKLVKEISGKGSPQICQIKGASTEERLQAWHSHFKSLLGNPPIIGNEDAEVIPIYKALAIEKGPFSLEEYRKAKSTLKAGKSCGEDGIVPEVLKWIPIDELILDIINKAYNSQDLPTQWSISNIVPIPKSGDLTKTDNYRGISLTSVVAKVYNRMLLNRIRPVLDPLLRTNQNGFREKRTTVQQVLALRRLVEGIKRKQLPAIITFIDFRKAFDSIHRGKLMKILDAYGIPKPIVNAISAMYANTSAKVLSPDGVTEPFPILAGVLQGDTLAPYLFIIALDYALRRAIDGKEEQLGFTVTPRKSRRVGPTVKTDFDFADDIALVSNLEDQAQELLHRVEGACGDVGLKLNAKKTEVMTFNIDQVELKTLDGSTLAVTEDFKYLGSYIGSTEKDITVRKALAWRALHSLKKIWKSSASQELKRSLFRATVEAILLYGSETWTLTNKQQTSLDGSYTRMLRMALNVTWRDRVSNDVLYGDLPKVTVKIRERRLRLAGHCIRHKELAVSDLILWEPTQGRSGRKSPRLTYVDILKKDTGLETSGELESLMSDRIRWQTIARGNSK